MNGLAPRNMSHCTNVSVFPLSNDRSRTAIAPFIPIALSNGYGPIGGTRHGISNLCAKRMRRLPSFKFPRTVYEARLQKASIEYNNREQTTTVVTMDLEDVVLESLPEDLQLETHQVELTERESILRKATLHVQQATVQRKLANTRIQQARPTSS
jgi:hypothetical protein